ncbi:MAG: NUMOD4 domain-containing protein [Candidatus Heimdallarchaeaceae archaeon]
MTKWKDIPEYENRYQVSSDGQVRSKTRYATAFGDKKLIKGRALKVKSIRKDGCIIYGLFGNNGRSKSINVTNLVKELWKQ